MTAIDVLEGDGNVTLEIEKTEKIDFDFDVIIIPVPLTAGELYIVDVYVRTLNCNYCNYMWMSEYVWHTITVAST